MRCRCCESEFRGEAILHFDNMPVYAQGFLEKEELDMDKGEILELYQCPYCGLIQIIGDPVPYYRDVIRASAVSEEMREFRINYFKNFVSNYGLTGKKIIEIGCGCGEFLELMNLTGVSGSGIENQKESVKKCQEKGLEVTEKFLEQEEDIIDGSPYDGFFIMSFLEHIPDPNIFLKAIHHNLAEDAIGLIEVPNVDMIIQKDMFSEFISDHLMYFTKDTFSFLLQKNGFEVIECYPVWHDYCLAAIVKKRNILKLDVFYEKMNDLSWQVNSYIEGIQSKGGKVAVWGAGHQALAFISLCGIGEKIEFIVDSATFKQGKYTPATHLRIVPPVELRNRNIDAVIVMAASYSDEVAGILKNDFKGIEVVILRDNGLEY